MADNETATHQKSTSVIDKSPTRIQRLFNTIAPRYDFLNHLLSFGLDRTWRWRTVQRLQPVVEGDLLDVCTGTADFAIAFAKRHTTRNVVGLDFSAKMLEVGQQRINKKKLEGKIKLLEGDALALPFANNTFAMVFVAYGLRNMQNPEKGLAEMVRVCKPGGTIAVLEFRMPERGVFAKCYRGYFRHLVPRIGAFVTGETVGAYRHLLQSVEQFPQGLVLTEMMQQAGISHVSQYNMTFNTVTLSCGKKQAD